VRLESLRGRERRVVRIVGMVGLKLDETPIFYDNTNITTVLPDFQDFHTGSVYFTAKMLAATDQL